MKISLMTQFQLAQSRAAVEMRRLALNACSYQHSCMHTITANHNKTAFTRLDLLITRREHGLNQTLFGFSAGWLQGLV